MDNVNDAKDSKKEKKGLETGVGEYYKVSSSYGEKTNMRYLRKGRGGGGVVPSSCAQL